MPRDGRVIQRGRHAELTETRRPSTPSSTPSRQPNTAIRGRGGWSRRPSRPPAKVHRDLAVQITGAGRAQSAGRHGQLPVINTVTRALAYPIRAFAAARCRASRDARIRLFWPPGGLRSPRAEPVGCLFGRRKGRHRLRWSVVAWAGWADEGMRALAGCQRGVTCRNWPGSTVILRYSASLRLSYGLLSGGACAGAGTGPAAL